MNAAGETELARVWTKVEQIRAKQKAKPKHSPLPAHVVAEPTEAEVERAERARIVKALKEEASLTPCPEDAAVTYENALLVQANFSYEERDRLRAESEVAARPAPETTDGEGGI